MCSDTAVNRGYPGNQVVGGVCHWLHQWLWEGKNAQREALFRGELGKKKETGALRGKKKEEEKTVKPKNKKVRTMPSERGVKTCLPLLLRTPVAWYWVNTIMAESLSMPQHTTHHFISQVRYWCMEFMAFSACCTSSRETESQERKDKTLECMLLNSFAVKTEKIQIQSPKKKKSFYLIFRVPSCLTFNTLKVPKLYFPRQTRNPADLYWWDLHSDCQTFLVYVIQRPGSRNGTSLWYIVQICLCLSIEQKSPQFCSCRRNA